MADPNSITPRPSLYPPDSLPDRSLKLLAFSARSVILSLFDGEAAMIHARFFSAVAVVLITAVALVAADKRPTGTTDGNVFRDSAYGFTLQKYDNWKFGKIEKEEPGKPRMTRCIITQKSVTYPPEYMGNEDKFTMPTIGVFVDTSSIPLEAYAAELADRKSKSPSRKELTRDFAVLGKGSFVEQGPITIDGHKSLLMHFRQDYEVQLYDRIKDQYKLKEDAILGDVYLIKRGSIFYILTLTCEREIYRTVNEEAKTMIMSVDVDPPADSTQGANSAAPGQ